MRKSKELLEAEKTIKDLQEEIKIRKENFDSINVSTSQLQKQIEACKIHNTTLQEDNERLVSEINELISRHNDNNKTRTEKETVLEFLNRLSKYPIAEQVFILKQTNAKFMASLEETYRKREKDFKYVRNNFEDISKWMENLSNDEIVAY